jgi:hypothetical protein
MYPSSEAITVRFTPVAGNLNEPSLLTLTASCSKPSNIVTETPFIWSAVPKTRLPGCFFIVVVVERTGALVESFVVFAVVIIVVDCFVVFVVVTIVAAVLVSVVLRQDVVAIKRGNAIYNNAIDNERLLRTGFISIGLLKAISIPPNDNC